MSLTIRYAARSHVGRVRSGNEDSGYAGPRLLVIADGMGGHAAGEVASAAAVQALRPLDNASVDEPRAELRAAIEAANEHLRTLVAEDPGREGMGTTLTALLWRGTGFTLAHIGDSRAYALRGGELTQISHDHTFVQTLVDEGRISADEAESHPQRNLILRSVSGHARLEVDVDDIEAQAGDRLLLCSDGLSGVVGVDELARILGDGDVGTVADRLIQAALDGGAPDNVTCVVAEVVDAGDTGVLPTTEPVGLLVGAVAEEATGSGGPGDASTEQPDRQLHDPDDDEEELLRYAPRPPARFLWLRRAGVVIVVAGVLLAAVFAGWAWTKTQYYIGVDGDRIAIYQGLDQRVAGQSLSQVYEVLPVSVEDLPTFDREQVTQSISSSSLDDARTIAARLETRAAACQQLRGEAGSAGSDGSTAGATGTNAGPAPTTAEPTPSDSTSDPEPSPTSSVSETASPDASPSASGPTPTPTPSEPGADDIDATVSAAECGLEDS